MPLRNIPAAAWSTKLSPVSLPSVTKASLSAGPILNMVGGAKLVWPRRGLAQFAKEGYIENADVFACINWLATAAKGIEFNAYTKASDGNPKNRKKITSGPAYELAKRPNPRQGWASFIEQLFINLGYAGNAYITRVNPFPTKAPTELWIERPERMMVIPGNVKKMVAGYEYWPTYQAQTGANPRWLCEWLKRPGDKIPGDQQQVCHLRLYHPLDDWYGLSLLEAAARSIDQNNNAEVWNNSLLQNGARPSGVVTIANGSPDQINKLADDFAAKHTGAARVGATLFTNGEDMSYTPIGLTSQEISWVEGQQLATQRICAVVGVPIELIAATQHRTFNNYHEATMAGYMHGVLPKYDYIVGELNYWLAPWFGPDVEFGYDRNDIEAIQEDRKYVSDRAYQGLQAGALMVDSYLHDIGHEPLPNGAGQTLLLPSTVTPTSVEDLGKVADKQPVLNPPPAPTVLPLGTRPVVTPGQQRPQLVAPPKR